MADVDILYHKDVCDEEEFYLPYVRLLRTRQPYHENSPILKLLGQGYIDVSRHTGILCINGPAIVYTDINKNTNKKCKSSSDWIPSNGEPEIFSHDCFSINRLSRAKYQQGELQELKRDSQVYGNKVFGVYLLASPPDYRLPSFVFLPRPDYGFKNDKDPWCIDEGASLAFMTNSSETSSHCYSVKKYNMDGILTVNYPGNPIFCFRDDKDDEFDTPFHKGKDKPLSSQDIVWTDNCDDDLTDSSFPSSGFEAEPMQLPDFRMIDPKLWSSQGSQAVLWKAKRKTGSSMDIPLYSKPHPPGSMFHDDPGWANPSTSEIEPVLDTEMATEEPYQKFQTEISLSNCEEVPAPPETCKPDLEEPCEILNHVLTLEETDWRNEVVQKGSWRLPIFTVINKIYEKACPQVSKYLSSSLSRVFQHSLFQELEADETLQLDFNTPQKQEWTELLSDLNICKEKAQMMNFFKKKDSSALKLKGKLEGKLETLHLRIANRIAAAGASATASERGSGGSTSDSLTAFSSNLSSDKEHLTDLEEVEKIQQQLNEVPLTFPYKILIGTFGSDGYAGATQVYNYREAAEIDHEFDWALDSYWKVISTVLGYCKGHYTKKESTFSRLYESFTEDFFNYISKAWIKGDNRPVYEQVFGEFIYGSGALWIDACHNGAYQWSEIVEQRPLRPLVLIEGDIPPAHKSPTNAGNNTGPPNFFLDNPVYMTKNADHYEYYDESDKDQVPDPSSPELYTLDQKNSGNRIERNALVESGNQPLTKII